MSDQPPWTSREMPEADPNMVKMTPESWKEVSETVECMADALAALLVSCGMAQTGERLDLPTMQERVDRHVEMTQAFVQRAGNPEQRALAALYGAIIPLKVSGRYVTFLDSTLHRATVNARRALQI